MIFKIKVLSFAGAITHNVSRLVKVAINCSQTNTKIPKRLKEKRELKNKIYSRKHAEKKQAKAIVTNRCWQ